MLKRIQKGFCLRPLSAILLGLKASLIVAGCGGGSGTDFIINQPPVSQQPGASADFPPWATSAVFVPLGQEEIIFDLQNCVPGAPAQEFTQPRLHIDSQGDSHISAMLLADTARSELARVNYGDETRHTLQFEFAGGSAQISNALKRAPGFISARRNINGITDVRFDVARTDGIAGIARITCQFVDVTAFVPQRFEVFTDARLGANMLEDVIAMIGDLVQSSPANTFTGGIAYWDALAPNALPSSSEALSRRFWSLDRAGHIHMNATDAIPRVNPLSLSYTQLRGSTSSYIEFVNYQDRLNGQPQLKTASVEFVLPDGFKFRTELRRQATATDIFIVPVVQ